MRQSSARTWPDEVDNDACAGPLQPDELAALARTRKQYRVWLPLFWLLAVAHLALALVTWRDLPERAPMHLGGPGHVDEWGSRTEWLVAMLVLWSVMVLLGPVMAWLIDRFPLQNTGNLNENYWKTPERRPLSNAHAKTFLMATMATALLLCLAETCGYWSFAHGHGAADWVMYVAPGVLAVQVVIGTVMVLRACRPPQWWRDCRHAHGHRWD